MQECQELSEICFIMLVDDGWRVAERLCLRGLAQNNFRAVSSPAQILASVINTVARPNHLSFAEMRRISLFVQTIVAGVS